MDNATITYGMANIFEDLDLPDPAERLIDVLTASDHDVEIMISQRTETRHNSVLQCNK